MAAIQQAMTPDEQHLFKQVGRQFPGIHQALTDARARELERMAQTSADQFLFYKGRVQALTEVQQLLAVK